MKVLYFADTRFPIERANGAQTMATCHALAARGHEVTLVVRPDNAAVARDPFAFYDWPRIPGLTIQTVAASQAPQARRIRFLVAAVAMTATHRDAVIYTRDLGVAALLLQKPSLRRPRVVYESHGVAAVVAEEMPRLLGKPDRAPSPSKLARLERRDRRVWEGASAYVTITQALADELTATFGPRRAVFVAPDGARDQGEPERAATPPDVTRGPIAGYAGHLYPWKGVDVLVRALAHAPGVRGLVVGGHPGEADRERVEALARELDVADRLEITGLVPPGEVAGRLARAAVLVLPNTASAISERYTSPLKLFEYLALRRPIVASDLPAIREILTDERTALLVPPGDARALAGAIARLVADPALSTALADAAGALAPSFTWAARAARVEAALDAAGSA